MQIENIRMVAFPTGTDVREYRGLANAHEQDGQQLEPKPVAAPHSLVGYLEGTPWLKLTHSCRSRHRTCSQGPKRACAHSHLKQQYVENETLKAECGAPLRVEVLGSKSLPANAHIEVLALQQHTPPCAHTHVNSTTTSTPRSRTSVMPSQPPQQALPQPLLRVKRVTFRSQVNGEDEAGNGSSSSGSGTSAGSAVRVAEPSAPERILLPLQGNCASLSAVAFRKGSLAVLQGGARQGEELQGRAPEVRMLLVLVDGGGVPLVPPAIVAAQSPVRTSQRRKQPVVPDSRPGQQLEAAPVTLMSPPFQVAAARKQGSLCAQEQGHAEVQSLPTGHLASEPLPEAPASPSLGKQQCPASVPDLGADLDLDLGSDECETRQALPWRTRTRRPSAEQANAQWVQQGYRSGGGTQAAASAAADDPLFPIVVETAGRGADRPASGGARGQPLNECGAPREPPGQAQALGTSTSQGPLQMLLLMPQRVTAGSATRISRGSAGGGGSGSYGCGSGRLAACVGLPAGGMAAPVAGQALVLQFLPQSVSLQMEVGVPGLVARVELPLQELLKGGVAGAPAVQQGAPVLDLSVERNAEGQADPRVSGSCLRRGPAQQQAACSLEWQRSTQQHDLEHGPQQEPSAWPCSLQAAGAAASPTMRCSAAPEQRCCATATLPRKRSAGVLPTLDLSAPPRQKRLRTPLDLLWLAPPAHTLHSSIAGSVQQRAWPVAA